MFSPVQTLVQLMNYVNMYAISPRYAAIGTMGTYLHMLGRLNSSEEFLQKLDEIASKMRLPGMPKYAPGEWLEAFKTIDKASFSNVGEEYALLGDMTKTHIIQRGTDKLLAAGSSPFRMGEKGNRIGAWYTAMKEHRDANPTGRITNYEMSK